MENLSIYEKKLLNKKKWYEKNKEKVKEYNKKYAQKIKNDATCRAKETSQIGGKTSPHNKNAHKITHDKNTHKIIRKTNSGGVIGTCDKRNSPHYCHTLAKQSIK